VETVADFFAHRRRALALEEAIAHIVQTYKNEITDWCGHDLAIEIAADKLGLQESTVRRIIASAGNIW
jgi:DNA-directed RNA polymerase specialized sigma24 family protein